MMKKYLGGVAAALCITALAALLFPDVPREFKVFATNPATLSFVLTLCMGPFGSLGIFRQIRKIQTGKSVPMEWHTIALTSFLSMVVYGISISSVAVTFQGVIRAAFLVPLVYMLWRRKGFDRGQWLMIGAALIVLCINAVTPGKGWFYIVLCYVAVASVAYQPYAIIREGSVGDVSPDLLVIYLISVTVFLIYGVLFRDWFVVSVVSGFLVAYSATLIVYVVYSRKPAARNAS